MYHRVNNALKEAERTAPKYATREDLLLNLVKVSASRHQPRLAWHRKPGAGPAIQREFLDAADGRYMMGRLMGGGAGFAQQPLFSRKTQPARLTVNIPTRRVKTWRSPARPHHDRTEDSHGTKTATTTTVTRGGFGESVAKQSICSVAQLAPLLVQWVADTDGRVSITERPDWREKAHEYGFNFTPCTASRTGVKMLTTS